MTRSEGLKDYQTSSGSAYHIFPKLGRDNYSSWSASMESVLRSLNQWKVVTGQIIAPVRAIPDAPTDEELQSEQEWELRKDRAYAEIALRIEEQYVVSIRGTRDPHTAWETLRNVHGNGLERLVASCFGVETCADEVCTFV